MVWFVLAVSIFNLALGYGAALALVEPPLWTGWRGHWPPRPARPQVPASKLQARSKAPVAAAEVAPGRSTIVPVANDLPTAASALADAAAATPVVAGFGELPP